eukprot:1364869-Amphidinium_carterae.2
MEGGGQKLAAIASPAFVVYLLRYVSGVPLLQRVQLQTPAYECHTYVLVEQQFAMLPLLSLSVDEANQKRYGADPLYIAYCQRTSLLVPFPPRSV